MREDISTSGALKRAGLWVAGSGAVGLTLGALGGYSAADSISSSYEFGKYATYALNSFGIVAGGIAGIALGETFLLLGAYARQELGKKKEKDITEKL